MYLLLLQGLTGFCNGLDSLVHVSLPREAVDHLVQCLRHSLGRLHRKGSSNPSENHSSYHICNNMHSRHTYIQAYPQAITPFLNWFRTTLHSLQDMHVRTYV